MEKGDYGLVALTEGLIFGLAVIFDAQYVQLALGALLGVLGGLGFASRTKGPSE